MLQEEIRTTGAVVMGRRAYDMAEGDLTDYEYQVPIFVLTHHIPEKVAKGVNVRCLGKPLHIWYTSPERCKLSSSSQTD